MQWYELADNPKAITELYQDVPSLKSVRLLEVHLSGRGPTMSLKLDLQFPDRPPTRWKIRGYNTVQLQLDFSFIESLRIKSRLAGNQVHIEIIPFPERYFTLRVFSSDSSIEAVANHFWITIHKFVAEYKMEEE